MTRVRVTAPRSITPGITGLPAARSAADLREAAEESDAGQVFIRSLIRTQLRLGIVVAAGFLLILAAFPLMLGLVPGLAESTIAGLPFDWVMLGAGIYPVVGLSAWLYVRTATRNEARYRDLAGDK
ncbi:hypothetical protein J2X01_000694 [Arthrobacter ginsengisoli]|uniref:Heavy metal transporter n=1 Tax=Arthrobacter ginsengisoli TaxID=1356565 RepID=A0ABU1U8A0_9MICC|nr:hypothetical protein [Arthrobacter ginsengisoli]MDR7081417.1 hypothetical protein [Arthrobacter ginsengisoli]